METRKVARGIIAGNSHNHGVKPCPLGYTNANVGAKAYCDLCCACDTVDSIGCLASNFNAKCGWWPESQCAQSYTVCIRVFIPKIATSQPRPQTNHQGPGNILQRKFAGSHSRPSSPDSRFVGMAAALGDDRTTRGMGPFPKLLDQRVHIPF